MTPSDYGKSDWGMILSAIAADLDIGRSGLRNEALWLEVRRRVHGYAWSILRSSPYLLADLDDVVQEVLLKLQSVEMLDRLAAKPHPGAYVIVMIRHAAIDVARRGQRERTSLERFKHEPGVVRPLPEEEDDGELLKKKLRVALRKLSPSDLALLRRRFAEGERLDAIAATAGVKYSTLAVRVSRLLDRIAREMGVPRKNRS